MAPELHSSIGAADLLTDPDPRSQIEQGMGKPLAQLSPPAGWHHIELPDLVFRLAMFPLAVFHRTQPHRIIALVQQVALYRTAQLRIVQEAAIRLRFATGQPGKLPFIGLRQ